MGAGRLAGAGSRRSPAHPAPPSPRLHQTLALQAKGARLVSITSVPGSALEDACDLAVHLPLERELCPFDLAPVTSTAIQMIFGDTVAIALMQARPRLAGAPLAWLGAPGVRGLGGRAPPPPPRAHPPLRAASNPAPRRPRPTPPGGRPST